MTDLDPELLALEGETIHVLAPSGLTVLVEEGSDDLYAFPRTVTLKRGDTLVLTESILRASLPRRGRSWLLDDDLAQRERWGEPRWGFGPFPATERVLIPGSVDALYLADEQRRLAWQTKAGPALAAALQDIERRLGRGGTKSVTLSSDRRNAERSEMDAAEQRRLVAAELQRQQDAARSLGGLG